MNKVQIVSYAKKTGTWPKYAECTTLAAPLSPDSFSYNFYDLTDDILWCYEGQKHVSIDSIDDFKSIRTMLEKSCNAINVIVFPQNTMYHFFSSSIGGYYEHRELKNIISNLTDILSDLIPISFPKIYYENTTSILNTYKMNASFCFESEKGEPLTFSDGGKKITTCKINDRLFLTTLNIFESPQTFEAFLNLIMPTGENETYPEWLYEVNVLDDQEQRDKIGQSEKIIGEEQAKIALAQEKLAANLKYKSILATNGDALVGVVFEILQELLNCDLSEFQDEHQEDFEIKKEDVTFIGEIKGVTSNVRSEHISQLDVHCQNYQDRLQEEGREETVKGLLIINHQRSSAPTERQVVHEIQIALADRNQSLIVETQELLYLFEAKQMGRVEVSQICRAFKEMTGIFHTETALKMYSHEDEDNTPYMG